MPLRLPDLLPAIDLLKEENIFVMNDSRATSQDIRPLKIVVLNLINSRHGRAIMAIRDNRIAAGSVGIPITRFKMFAFTVSAVIAGCAGALYSHNLSSLIATPARFGYNMSILFLVFVVLGGIGSTRGAIIASIALTLIPEVLRFMADYRMLIYAIVLIVMMIVNWNPRSRAWIQAHSLTKLFRRKEGS